MDKMIKTPFSGHGEKINELLGLIHIDVCGPMTIEVRGGCSYFITFINDLSRFEYMCIL